MGDEDIMKRVTGLDALIRDLERRAGLAAAELVPAYAVLGEVDEDRLNALADQAKPDIGWPERISRDYWMEDVKRRARMAGDVCRPNGVEEVTGGLWDIIVQRMANASAFADRLLPGVGKQDERAQLMAAFRVINRYRLRYAGAVGIGQDLVRFARSLRGDEAVFYP